MLSSAPPRGFRRAIVYVDRTDFVILLNHALCERVAGHGTPKQLKGRSRSKEMARIAKMNPGWRDLSEASENRCGTPQEEEAGGLLRGERKA